MKVLLVASTTAEIKPFLDHMDKTWEKVSFTEYKKNNMTVFPLVTGNTQFFMTYAMCKFPGIEHIDKAINVGLAVSTTRILDIGETVNVGRDIFGDIGMEESDGNFLDMFDLKYLDSNRYPFFKAELFNEDITNPLKHRVVKSLSVNTFPGTFESIEKLNKKYHAEIVSTNGAAFAYTCRMLDVKYLQYRTIQRYLEPNTHPERDQDLAILELNKEIIKILEEIRFENRNLLNLFD